MVEATLRRRLFHRGMRVDAWVGSLLRDEAGRRTRTGSAADGPVPRDHAPPRCGIGEQLTGKGLSLTM
ncbi:hypothetical protein GCM10018953_18650 [Streptosporangium nondiastaticum]